MSITKINTEITMDIVNAMQNGKAFTGIKTGYIDLDYALGGGLEKGKVYLVAGRPAMGKTAFATNIALSTMKAGQNVIYMTGDLSKEKLIERMIKTDAYIERHFGEYTEEEMARMIDSAKLIGQGSFVVEDGSVLSLESIFQDTKGFYKEADLIITDCLQLMTLSRDMHGFGELSLGKEQEQICKELHAYAKENDVTIVLLSQMSRRCEARADHRPILSDLRHPVDQYVDVVMALYRDEYYDYDSELRGIAEVHILKNNNGKLGCVNLLWVSQLLKFATMECVSR